MKHRNVGRRQHGKGSRCHDMTCDFCKFLTKLQHGARAQALSRRPAAGGCAASSGCNQSAMAGEIGVSPSYLNHLERNQRPVTAAGAAAPRRGLSTSTSRASPPRAARAPGADQLAEIFADPMFADLGIAALRAGRGGRQCAGRRRRASSRLYAALRRAAPRSRRRREASRRARADHARKPGCATISRRSATISPIWRRRPRRWPARSATRCRSPSRCGGG